MLCLGVVQEMVASVKEAAKIPTVHGTNQAYKVLRGRLPREAATFALDPNPAGLYMAAKTRSGFSGASGFARSAAKSRGGAPLVATAKIDTARGWRPRLKPTALRSGVTHDDVVDMIELLDEKGTSRTERGEAWRFLNKHVGAWVNTHSGAKARPHKWSAALKS